MTPARAAAQLPEGEATLACPCCPCCPQTTSRSDDDSSPDRAPVKPTHCPCKDRLGTTVDVQKPGGADVTLFTSTAVVSELATPAASDSASLIAPAVARTSLRLVYCTLLC